MSSIIYGIYNSKMQTENSIINNIYKLYEGIWTSRLAGMESQSLLALQTHGLGIEYKC